MEMKNGTTVHARESNHTIRWDGARVKRSGMTGYCQRRTTEPIHIKQNEKTMNLDGGSVEPSPEPTLTTGCPQWVPVGLCPHHPSLLLLLLSLFILYYYYYYSRLVTCPSSRHSPHPMMSQGAVYIRPNHSSFFSIITDKDLCG